MYEIIYTKDGVDYRVSEVIYKDLIEAIEHLENLEFIFSQKEMSFHPAYKADLELLEVFQED